MPVCISTIKLRANCLWVVFIQANQPLADMHQPWRNSTRCRILERLAALRADCCAIRDRCCIGRQRFIWARAL